MTAIGKERDKPLNFIFSERPVSLNLKANYFLLIQVAQFLNSIHLKTFLFILLLSGLFMHGLQAQQTLDLLKRGSKTHYYFQAGDTISLALRNKQQMKDVWAYAGDSAIWLGDTVVQLKDIRWIDIADHKQENLKFNQPANLLIAAGVAYFALDQLNRVVYSDAQFSLDRNVALASGSLLASGLLAKVLAGNLRKHKARIGKKYTIYLTDHSSN
jgi:hypothetical protein